MTQPLLEIVLAACIVVFIYHHVIYPVLVKVLARRLRGRLGSPLPVADAALPRVAVVMPAYNEANFIAEKIHNLAALDYPRDLLRVVIALDGCTDATQAQAEAAMAALPPGHGMELVVFARNRGKVAVLNDRIAAVDTDIVMLTDASAMIRPSAVRQAVAHFADARIGVVFGTYRLREAGSEGERAYTNYQTQMRADEGVLDAPMGGHGALYFFRRNLWQRMPPDTINDDFILPMSIVANGAGAIYDQDIVAEELERTHSSQEFKRRVRIGAGNLQQAVRLGRLASLRRPWLAFTFLSGKGSRPFMPFIGILAIAATAKLAADSSGFYTFLLMMELMILTTAGLVILLRPSGTPRILAWLAYLVEGHFASFVGAMQVILGLRLKHWQPEVTDAAQR